MHGRENVDEGFFDRADDHITLANGQLDGDCTVGQVSASMMYAMARYGVWVWAAALGSVDELRSCGEDMKKYFLDQFEKMLDDNLEEYVENFHDLFPDKILAESGQ